MPRVPEEKIDEIRSATNIVHYINQYVNLKKAGRNYKGLCPFHTEKTPSFIVSPEKQIYHCFGCGKGGNIFSFIMEYEKLSFSEALEKAAEFCGIELPKSEPVSREKEDFFQQLYEINEQSCVFFEQTLYKPENQSYLQYFLKRGLSAETVRKFRLGYAPDSFDRLLGHLKNQNMDLEKAAQLGVIQKKERGEGYYDKFRHRIIFPFINVSGKIVGFGGRKLKEEQQPKYLNSPESPVYKKGSLLYGLHQAIRAIREAEFAFLVEGYFDLLSLVEKGYRNTIASSGTALTEIQAKLLRRYTRNVYIAYDGDEAGMKAAIRVAYILENQDLNSFILPIPADTDPDSILQEHGDTAFNEIIGKKLSPVEFELNRFFEQIPSPSLQEKETLIREILQALLEQPNHLKIGLTLHQIADRLQVNENLLIEQFNQLKKKQVRRSSTDTGTETTPTPIKFHKGAYQAERALISLLLSDNETVRKFVFEHISAEMFENAELRNLFDLINNEFEEVGRINVNALLTISSNDQTMNSLISELMLQNHEEQIKYARDCVYQIKKWHLEKKSKDLSALIKAESDSIDSVMHYTKELSFIRKEIAELDRQLRSSIDKKV